MKEWIDGLSVFLRGTFDEQIKRKFSTSSFQAVSVTHTPTKPNPKGQTFPVNNHFYFCIVSDCFSVYDVNGDQSISREEMFLMLKNSFLRLPTDEDPDEGVKDLVEIAIRRMVRDLLQDQDFSFFQKKAK